MEAGHVTELIEANIFNPEDYNHGPKFAKSTANSTCSATARW